MSVPLARLETSSEGRVLVAAITGEIDMSNAGTLTDAVLRAVTNDMDGLVVDLSAVEYLDSAAIHGLFRVRERLAHRGQGLGLVVPDRATSGDALRLAGVDSVIRICPTRAEAVAAIATEHGDP